MIYIGIDPGKTGAIAFIDGNQAWSVKNRETMHDLVEAVRDATEGRTCTAVIEKVHSSPQMGVVSAFTFGQSYGQLEMLLTALGIRYEHVSPQKWQGDMKCRTGGDKNITKAKAQQLFPDVKITHANADALLIAEYCRRIN
jgi:hypothetical protein